ncbi:hypothetical protein J5N97_000039 [Dioscorea zingiberensis]|uniref:Uncharacterized protein n=1 Tax=Dioscorea zingiberensis TaxID=325984 RepID=A0A9D5BW69_9LILI|nr:hypothetical protein J5N97_000039 [Dioscorea zingiberensis]
MDPSELRHLEDDDTPIMKTIKGQLWDWLLELSGVLLLLLGNYGLTFAAIGGLYIGVEEQVVEKYRMKRDFVNGAVGAFVAGAAISGFKGRGISSAISAGSALAVTSAVLDIGGQTTRVDNGKEYYPYTVQKRPTSN